ncbi:hypothetical protein ACFLR2_01020 [Chlamydiota bacterium]
MTVTFGLASTLYVNNNQSELQKNGNTALIRAGRCSALLMPLLDIIATLTLVILGVLALHNIVHFTPAVAWGLIGAGATWGALAVPGMVALVIMLRRA